MEVNHQNMDSKIKVLALIAIIVAATVATSLVIATQLVTAAKADTYQQAAQDATLPQTSTAFTNSTDNSTLPFIGHMRFGGFRIDRGGFGPAMMGGMGGFGQIQISSDFTTNVTNIAKNDTDVQNLISQGYNITTIRPVITTTIDGNGNIITKATTADVTLQGTNGRALVVVDLNQDKVTKIDTFTWTEIDK